VSAFLGILIAGTALGSSEIDNKFGWHCILGGPVLFIILGQYAGMIPAVFACVFVCALGDKTATYKSSAMLAAAVTVFGVLLFHYLLGSPFPAAARGQPVISTAITDRWYGFGVALEPHNLEPHNLMYCFFGVLVGVLPGMGPVATISILLPLTFGMQPVPAILMLSGVYYGAQYGGAICSILLNLPCHPPYAVTCLDGFPPTKQGKRGTALGITIIAAFIGASFGITEVIFLAPFLVKMAREFGPTEVSTLMSDQCILSRGLRAADRGPDLCLATLTQGPCRGKADRGREPDHAVFGAGGLTEFRPTAQTRILGQEIEPGGPRALRTRQSVAKRKAPQMRSFFLAVGRIVLLVVPTVQPANNRLSSPARERDAARAIAPAGGVRLQSIKREAISSCALWCHISASASSRQLSNGRNTALCRHSDSMAR
jgi:hypothetical protein